MRVLSHQVDPYGNVNVVSASGLIYKVLLVSKHDSSGIAYVYEDSVAEVPSRYGMGVCLSSPDAECMNEYKYRRLCKWRKLKLIELKMALIGIN